MTPVLAGIVEDRLRLLRPKPTGSSSWSWGGMTNEDDVLARLEKIGHPPSQVGEEIRGTSGESRFQFFEQIVFPCTADISGELLYIEASGGCPQFLDKARGWPKRRIKP